MKKLNPIITIALTALLLNGCHIYQPFKSPEVKTDSLYRVDNPATDSTNMGNYQWQQIFTDPHLQLLINEGLLKSVDLQSARLRVEQSQALLLAAKLGFLPSIGLSPQANIAGTPGSAAAFTYQVPITASWEIDLFGKQLNTKRGANSELIRRIAQAQSTRSQLLANIATNYYTLLMLDKQLEINNRTLAIWQENVRTLRAMKLSGSVNQAAISQSLASCSQVKSNSLDLERQIREVENAICLILMRTPQPISRGTIDNQQLPEQLKIGLPLQVLSNRPDVKMAEMNLANTYYSTNVARSAFYPQLTIGGSLGFTNAIGEAILNPGQLILSAIGSLTQPIFNRGKLVANLKVSKAEEKIAQLQFEQSVLNAGREVSNYLFQYQTALHKKQERTQQLQQLNNTVSYTQQLFEAGGATYLETLVAQQSLLTAQLSEVADTYEQMQAVVSLYQALGGGRAETESNPKSN